MSEAHVGLNKSLGPFKGHGCKHDKSFRRGHSRSDLYNRNNSQKQNRDIGQKPTEKHNYIYHRCGLSGY